MEAPQLPERLAAVTEICQTNRDDERTEPAFPRVYKVFERKVEARIGNFTMKFIGKDDLMRNKAATGRAKDLIDLEELGKL